MMRRLVLIFGLCLLWLAAYVSAQDNPAPLLPTATATPVPPTATSTALATLAVTTDPLLFAPSVEVAFPAGVRFFIRVIARSEAILNASLTLERPNQPPLPFAVDLATGLVAAGEYSDLSFVWELTPEVYPAFFEPIEFRWEVEVIGGTSTARGRFEFTDERLRWETVRSRDGQMTLILPRQQGGTRLLEAMTSVQNAMATYTDTEQTFGFILYDQQREPDGCIVGEDGIPYAFTLSGLPIRCLDLNLASRIFSASGLQLVRVGSFTQSDMQDAVSQALFERYYREDSGESGVPAWFAFGLMRIYTPTDHTNLLSIAREASRSSQWFAQGLMEQPPDNPGLRRIWQAQSLAMTLYMADRLGFPELFRFATLARQVPFAEQFQQALGQPVSALIPSVRDWLFTTRAEAAFSVSIYSQATQTPAPSATITPFPPTRTLRPEPSATMTPTITLTPSPRPTTTATASVTPRPPGSLATPTPIPAETTSPLIDPSLQTSLIAVMGIFIAVLVLLFARVGRR